MRNPSVAGNVTDGTGRRGGAGEVRRSRFLGGESLVTALIQVGGSGRLLLGNAVEAPAAHRDSANRQHDDGATREGLAQYRLHADIGR